MNELELYLKQHKWAPRDEHSFWIILHNSNYVVVILDFENQTAIRNVYDTHHTLKVAGESWTSETMIEALKGLEPHYKPW